MTSGQIGLVDNVMVDGLGPQCDAALANLGLRLAEAGLKPTDVMKTTVFMVSMDDYGVINEHYVAFFGAHRPARSAVAVSALPAGALMTPARLQRADLHRRWRSAQAVSCRPLQRRCRTK